MTAIEVCERLATLARGGYPVRAALVALAAGSEKDDDIVAVARRAMLGAPIPRCVEPLAPAFGSAFPRFTRSLLSGLAGANWAQELDDLARHLRQQDSSVRSASVAAAGATLSARMIAALPVLMLPVSIRQLGDPAVAVSVVLGIALGYVGYRWLMRTVPAPAGDDPVASLADELAAALMSGRSLDQALRDAAQEREGLAGLVRKVSLGARWSEVLAEHLPAIGRALSDASRVGVPVATSLRVTARRLRHEASLAFDRKVERAPVKMVVPLVSCILPSFILVTIVPLLRGLAQPA